MASAEVIFLIVVTADPIYLDCWVINTRKNKKAHNLLQVVNRRETALFRADEPTGVGQGQPIDKVRHGRAACMKFEYVHICENIFELLKNVYILTMSLSMHYR